MSSTSFEKRRGADRESKLRAQQKLKSTSSFPANHIILPSSRFLLSALFSPSRGSPFDLIHPNSAVDGRLLCASSSLLPFIPSLPPPRDSPPPLLHRNLHLGSLPTSSRFSPQPRQKSRSTSRDLLLGSPSFASSNSGAGLRRAREIESSVQGLQHLFAHRVRDDQESWLRRERNVYRSVQLVLRNERSQRRDLSLRWERLRSHRDDSLRVHGTGSSNRRRKLGTLGAESQVDHHQQVDRYSDSVQWVHRVSFVDLLLFELNLPPPSRRRPLSFDADLPLPVFSISQMQQPLRRLFGHRWRTTGIGSSRRRRRIGRDGCVSALVEFERELVLTRSLLLSKGGRARTLPSPITRFRTVVDGVRFT